MNNHLIVLTDEERWQQALSDAEPFARQVFGCATDFLKENRLGGEIGFDKPVVINLSLSNNDEVRRLNAEFRGKDKPTNVLSFANIDDDNFADELENADEVELGDIIVALETLEEEALQKGIPLKDHFAHLLIHGILHLFGYDHQDDDEADEMEAVEIKILSVLNIDNPYAE